MDAPTFWDGKQGLRLTSLELTKPPRSPMLRGGRGPQVRLERNVVAAALVTTGRSYKWPAESAHQIIMHKGGKPIGLLAIQGDFALHAKMLDRIGAPWKLVKHAAELREIGGLILPGGESTTHLKFFPAEGLGEAIKEFAGAGKPVFGTCAGAILLAKEVTNPPQDRLGLLDIAIERNAYGRQVDSSVRRGECPELSDHPIEMVFIRAPIVRRVGSGVRVLGRCDGLPVLVEQGNLLAATFHPELTEDETVHRYFLKKLSH